jgi:hypothetical protein
MRRLVTLLLGVLLLALSGAPVCAEKRVALVIGNSEYQEVPRLPNPKNDAGDMRSKLSALSFQIFGGNDLNRASMISTLTSFGRAAESADVALVFYAGHGLQVNGQNYLVPVDANVEFEAELEISLVPLSLVMQQLARGSRINIVLLDACRDNPFAKSLSRSMGTRAVGSLGRGLSPLRSIAGTYIGYATAPDSVAQDGDGRNSPFTSALLKFIDRSGLSLSDLMIEVRSEVIEATNGKQVPWDTSSLTGRFYFKVEGTVSIEPMPGKPFAQPDSTSTPLDPGIADMKAWLATQGSEDPQDFETYLRDFPNGTYVRKAQMRLDALRRPPVAALSPDTQTRAPAPVTQDLKADQSSRWATVSISTNIRDFELFLQDYPNGPYAAEAANNIGVRHFNGTGTPRNLVSAAHFFQRGVDLGNSHAANNLGNMYATGNGVPHDDARAAELYRRGAELGHPDAMTNFGIMLATGRGGVRNEAQAVALYRQAGNANGLMLLAGMVDGGRGTARNPDESANLYLECQRVGQPTCRTILIEQRGKQISLETRRRIQQKLAEKGLYKGPTDGVFGAPVVRALEAVSRQ